MKFFRLDLLTLLISLFILNSCKNQDTIGLGVNSANQLNGSLIDTATVVVNTVPEDSVQTDALRNTPLSNFKDPVLGTTEANMIMDLNLPGGAAYVTPNGTITIDSAVLILPYVGGAFYGDSITSRYKVNVYQLSERVFGRDVYANTKKWKYNNSVVLGTRTFNSRTGDSVKITNALVGRPDTLVNVAPQLRIPMDPNFINSILFNASQAQIGSNLIFKNNVNGLYITLDKNQAGPGGTFMFALDSARVNVYYRADNGSTIDTALVAMAPTLHAAEIKHTYSPTVQTELNNTTASRNVFYLQGLAGLRTRISFPYIKNIVKSLGSDVVVNRAELVISPVPGSGIPFIPLRRLTMYKYDIAKQRTYIEDSSPNDPRSLGSGAGGYYNIAAKSYHFILSGYIQDLMRGVTTNNTAYISPADPTDFAAINISANPQVDGRTIAIGSDKTSPYRIKLNIYYTKIAK